MWTFFVAIITLTFCVVTRCLFMRCHDDNIFNPMDGLLSQLQFTWLGSLQYIHVTNGNPHYFRVPRVVLISPQFCLCTAFDASHVPNGYALGNVIFGDYERDEVECQITVDLLASGVGCDPVILVMPIADVLLHPEHKHFGQKHSLALLKLLISVKSNYVLPVCVPYNDFLNRSKTEEATEPMYHIDYYNEVPRDFMDEEKEVYRLNWLPRERCYTTEEVQNSSLLPTTLACTEGCGFRSGAPTVVHELTGHWSLVALAIGGPPCPDPLRSRKPTPSPYHIMIHPYVPWISTAISGTVASTFAKDDPFGYVMPRTSASDPSSNAWVGHWWMGGERCFDRGVLSDDVFKFYRERFTYNPIVLTNLTYFLQIEAPRTTVIICVKIGMPHRLYTPSVSGIDSNIAKVKIPLVKLSYEYVFHVVGYGRNRTSDDTPAEG